ncbi:MAG: acyl-CoA-binding protein [Cyclobacteriaceae bacterium]|nr:acyl-CoA-binding protein [Cyclobacteriaceae bacterium]
MELQDKFQNAVSLSKQLTERPSNEELLQLYALYKQALEGDNKGDRPGGFDFKGAAKHDAWDKIKGMSLEEAMNQYIRLVDKLHKK